jgi:hypothetical protein
MRAERKEKKITGRRKSFFSIYSFPLGLISLFGLVTARF